MTLQAVLHQQRANLLFKLLSRRILRRAGPRDRQQEAGCKQAGHFSVKK